MNVYDLIVVLCSLAVFVPGLAYFVHEWVRLLNEADDR